VLNESRRQKTERLQRQIASVPPSDDIAHDDNDDDDDDELLLPSESPQQPASIN